MGKLGRGFTAFAVTIAVTYGLFATKARSDNWLRADSDHFTVYSTVNDKETRTYVRKLEQFRSLTNLLLGTADAGPQVRFVIYLIPQDHMIQVRPSFSPNVSGVYLNCSEGTTAYSGYSRIDDFDFEADDNDLITLFHEYSHHVMFQHAHTLYPAWYVEGFAEFLSTADPRQGAITVGEASRMRSWTLAEDRWIDFNKVLDPDFAFAGAKTNNEWEIESFYSQSWLLTHYMLSDNERAKGLNAYFARLAKGEAPAAAWEAATGIKVASLTATLKRYRDKMYFLRVPIADYADSSIAISRVPPADQVFLFDASLLTTCPAPDQGKAILSRLQAQKAAAGDNPSFRMALARAQLLYGDVAATVNDMDSLASADPNNADAIYLLGRGLLKQAEDAKGPQRDELREEAQNAFLMAYRIRKLDAQNLYYLGQSFSGTPGFPDKNAMNAANGAHVLAPGVSAYAIFAAFTDLSNDQREAAAVLLTPYVSDPHNRKAAARFKAAVDAIHAGKPTSEVMGILNGPGDD